MIAQRILETSLYVDDLELAEWFYGQVLGLELQGKRDGRHVFFRCGAQMLLLFNPDATGADSPADAGDPATAAAMRATPHGARGPGHMAFALNDTEYDDWLTHLKRCGVPIEQETAWPQGGRSIYFRDPAGNSLELATPQIWGLDEIETPPATLL